MRITPENITSLKPNQVFVFGSNFAGIHGAGAAKTAKNLFGAEIGVGIGFTGQCYAIPTKDEYIDTLPLVDIKTAVKDFIRRATSATHKQFLVTAIGCGLAGFEPKDIAPMFRDAIDLENVWLPESFIRIITAGN